MGKTEIIHRYRFRDSKNNRQLCEIDAETKQQAVSECYKKLIKHGKVELAHPTLKEWKSDENYSWDVTLID